MIVSELIEKLKALPPDAIVYKDREGELLLIRHPRVADCHTYHIGGSVTEDYLPECKIDDDEAKFKAVIVE